MGAISWLGWIWAVFFGFALVSEILQDFSNPWGTITIGVKGLIYLVMAAPGVVLILVSQRKRK